MVNLVTSNFPGGMLNYEPTKNKYELVAGQFKSADDYVCG